MLEYKYSAESLDAESVLKMVLRFSHFVINNEQKKERELTAHALREP
jgi:hypothetical protein